MLLKPLYVRVEVPDASQKLDGKDASVGLNDAQRHHRMNFPGSIVGNSFTEVSDIVVQYVICFSRSISSAKRFAWKIPVATLAQYRAVSALTCSPTATGICESKS